MPSPVPPTADVVVLEREAIPGPGLDLSLFDPGRFGNGARPDAPGQHDPDAE